jgi:hypothetical protein
MLYRNHETTNLWLTANQPMHGDVVRLSDG